MTTSYKDETWIALGDSITEGATYSLWISQSIKAAGKTPPHWINAGVGGNTTVQILDRLDRDVIQRHPDRVVFAAGLNDVLQGKSAAFFTAVPQIFDRLKTLGVPVYVCTTTALAGKHDALNATLGTMNDTLRKLAQEHGFTVVEVFNAFRAALEKSEPLVSTDDIHLEIEGYKIMSTAILKALDPAVPLAPNFDPKLEPGVPLDWDVRAANTTGPVWQIHLPESGSTGNWWRDFERVRGYVLDLTHLDPKAEKFIATASFTLAEPGPVFVRIGGGVQSISIDGMAVTIPPTNTLWGIRELGWSQPLAAGRHEVEILVAHFFFVSCLPKSEWPSR